MQNGTLLVRSGLLVTANGARNLPPAGFVLPEMNELPHTAALCVFVSRAIETMDGHLGRL